MDLMWIKYIGDESPHRDNLYRTGWWKTGEEKQVLAFAGKKLLRHPDMFEAGSGSSGGSGGGSYNDSELRAKIQANTTALNGKVDKVTGKGLSSADFTAAEKSKLAGLSNYDDAALKARVTALEAAGTGSGTSYDDTALKSRLTAAETALANKVDKVSGKGLSTNDFTSAEKTKLAGLSNYNDAALVGRVAALEAKDDADTKPELAAALTATQTVGGVASGTAYPAGTSLESIIRAILAPAATPQPTANLPIFATKTSRFTLEEVAVDNSAGEFIIDLAEQTETEPVYFDVPTAWNAQVTIWNALTNQWQTTGAYVSSAVTHDINGTTVNYTRWTDMSEMDIGPTQARITWTV